MDKVALLPASDRAALFGETGAGRGVANTIIHCRFGPTSPPIAWSATGTQGVRVPPAAPAEDPP